MRVAVLCRKKGFSIPSHPHPIYIEVHMVLCCIVLFCIVYYCIVAADAPHLVGFGDDDAVGIRVEPDALVLHGHQDANQCLRSTVSHGRTGQDNGKCTGDRVHWHPITEHG